MTEISGVWSTGTSGDGTSTYTQANASLFFKVMAACAGFEGVAPGYLNSLAASGTSSPVSVNTGGAMVDGKAYHNDAAVSVAIPTPVTYSRIDRIVLRASWGTTYTVRATRIAGTEAASPTAPAITQTSGTTYDIKLYQALITTGGVITLTDERTWASPFVARQGGSATIWGNSGTTNYPPCPLKIEFGEATISSDYQCTVTFPVAFSQAPLVYISQLGQTKHLVIYTCNSTTLQVVTIDNSSTTQSFNWIAIGPP